MVQKWLSKLIHVLKLIRYENKLSMTNLYFVSNKFSRKYDMTFSMSLCVAKFKIKCWYTLFTVYASAKKTSYNCLIMLRIEIG